MTEQLLTVQDVAAILKINPRTIRNMTGRKAKRQFPIPVKRVGAAVRFRRSDVEAFIMSGE
jgi:excisionase family DNA binding protein